MLRLLNHHLRSAAPLVAMTGLLGACYSLSRAWYQLASAGSSTGLMGVLGEGVDEFGTRVGIVSSDLAPLFSDANNWMTAAALAATAVSVISAVRQLSEWVHGPGDAVAFTRHIADRAKGVIGTTATPVRWGMVHDALSRKPLPFARVNMLDEAGGVYARAIADRNGNYGFHITAEDMRERGGVRGIEVFKDGYYHHAQARAVTAGAVVHNPDIPLVRLTSVGDEEVAPVGRGMRIARSVAFWGGVLTVPMVYLAAPGPGGAVLVALFGFSAIVRAVGSGMQSDESHILRA